VGVQKFELVAPISANFICTSPVQKQDSISTKFAHLSVQKTGCISAKK